MFEDLLTSEVVGQIALFLSGALVTGLIWFSARLRKSFKESSNKFDDILIPALDNFEKALKILQDLDKKQDDQTKKLDELKNV